MKFALLYEIRSPRPWSEDPIQASLRSFGREGSRTSR
jgi:hypothetical protein